MERKRGKERKRERRQQPSEEGQEEVALAGLKKMKI